MKVSNFYLFFALFLAIATGAQESPKSPSVSSMIQFSEYPLDHFTGAPQVSIPLFNMPTRSKDIYINTSLNYHPSAIAAQNRFMGDAGRGWNLTLGGVITRNIISALDYTAWAASPNFNGGDDIYHFNFMGFSGKFSVVKEGSSIIAEVIEGDVDMRIDVIFNPTTYEQTSFKFYDTKGYVYIFSTADDVLYRNGNRNITLKTSFQLTSIYDNNNNVLVNYAYDNIMRTAPNHPGYQNYKVIRDVSIPGFGKIEISKTFLPSENWLLFTGMAVKNLADDVIKQFEFSHDIGFYNNPEDVNLVEVISAGGNESSTESYKLFYKEDQSVLANSVFGTDKWGYPNKVDKWCDVDQSIKDLADVKWSRGILEKMILPTGGCTIYDFESNTYSFEGDVDLDRDFNSYNAATQTFGTIQDFYVNSTEPKNNHNFITTPFRSADFSGGSYILTFNISQPNTSYYLKFDGERYATGIDLDGVPMYGYPQFTLKKGSTILAEFKAHVGNYNNGDNNCKGKLFNFSTTGNYSITMNNPTTNVGSVSLYTVAPASQIKKWWHGGGIRIKRIAYFDKDVDQNYYSLRTRPFQPIREISFDYNLFNDSSKSSGSLQTDGGMGNYLVNYSNVTAYDSYNKGRVEYTYSTATHDVPITELSNDFRTGKIKKIKVYDEAGVLQTESTYDYVAVASGQITDPAKGAYYITGWIAPSKISRKEYFFARIMHIEESFLYNSLRQVIEKEVTTSRDYEKLITKYSYHSGNSIYSKNRIGELEYIKEYLNTELLSTKKIEYSNSWNNVLGTAVNVSYLPIEIKLAKGSAVLERKSKINIHDMFGHPLEIEQESGIKKVYIWGYNSSQIIAEIDNISYSAIPSSLITEAQVASDSGDEAQLLIKLSNLRSAPQLAAAYISTFTYKPLVGIISSTDARGYRTTYEYDTNNRLKATKDQAGNILTENQHHTKPHN
ncbi:MAG: hypothetical protein EOO42_09410 [Flavobacteriales bacterium]|nr:MAG: hypothetical protein EOO42_09410 [Flavobacteriales bacterium]